MSHTPTDDVRQHLVRDALRRYWVIILLCAVVLGAAAGAYVHTRPTSYTSSATVLIQPTVGNPFGPNSTTSATQVVIAIQTEATVVDSAPVAALSNKTLAHKWTPGSGTVAATVPPNTQTLMITFKAPSAREAQAGAQAVATGYLNYRHAQSVAAINAGSGVLSGHISTLNKQLAAAQRQAAQSKSSTATATANQQIQGLTGQLVSLQSSLTQLQASATAPGQVISPAKLPSKPAGLSGKIYIGVGVVLGLLLGFVLALALTRRDKRVRRSAAAVHDIPVLAVVSGGASALLRHGGEHGQRGLRVAYQRLRLGILAARPRGSAIALNGLSDRDAVGDVAAELASSFTSAAYRVVVVIAATDTIASSAIEVAGKPGLSDVLVGAKDWHEVLLERDGVDVLPPGQNLDDVQERLSSDRFRTLLAELAASCDYVFVVAPPMTNPAGVAVARAARGTLLVGREMRTTSVDVESAADQAELVGARVVGLVVRVGRVSPKSVRRRRTSPLRAATAEPARSSRQSGEGDGAAAFARVPEDESGIRDPGSDRDDADIDVADRSGSEVNTSSGSVRTSAGRDQAGGRP